MNQLAVGEPAVRVDRAVEVDRSCGIEGYDHLNRIRIVEEWVGRSGEPSRPHCGFEGRHLDRRNPDVAGEGEDRHRWEHRSCTPVHHRCRQVRGHTLVEGIPEEGARRTLAEVDRTRAVGCFAYNLRLGTLT